MNSKPYKEKQKQQKQQNYNSKQTNKQTTTNVVLLTWLFIYFIKENSTQFVETVKALLKQKAYHTDSLNTPNQFLLSSSQSWLGAVTLRSIGL